MNKQLSPWHITAGILWAIISLMLFVSLLSVGDVMNQDGAGIGVIFILLLLAFYICCCVSMFTQKKGLLRTGTVGIAVLYILLFLIIFIGFTQESYGGESLASQVGFGFMFFLFAGCVVQIMAYFSLGGLAKKLENRISIKKYWYRPGLYFVACFVCMLIALSSFASKYGSSLSNLNLGSLFSNWTNFLWIAVLIFSGMALYTEENPAAFSGAGTGNMYGQQMNPYGQQPMQPQQPMNQFGQQPMQPMNQLGQQPMQPMNQFGQQPMQPMNQFGQQPMQPMNQFGQQPIQPQQMNQFGQQPMQPQQMNQFGQQPMQPADPYAQQNQYNNPF